MAYDVTEGTFEVPGTGMMRWDTFEVSYRMIPYDSKVLVYLRTFGTIYTYLSVGTCYKHTNSFYRNPKYKVPSIIGKKTKKKEEQYDTEGT